MYAIAKPNQDLRFDVPVIGVEPGRLAAEVKFDVIATKVDVLCRSK